MKYNKHFSKRKLLKETTNVVTPEEDAGGSFDLKVDKMLQDFQTGASVQGDPSQVQQPQQESKKFSLTKFLFEAPDDETEFFPVDEKEQDAPADDSEEPQQSEYDENAPKLDVTNFSDEVARMIKNRDNLFDIQDIMLRRSLNYVTRTYGQATSKQISDILDKEFDIRLSDKESEFNAAPNATGAGPEIQ